MKIEARRPWGNRMDGPRQFLAIVLFTMNLSGMMLLMVSASKQVPIKSRRTILVSGVLLNLPGVIFMLSTIPLRGEDVEDEDDVSDDMDEMS